MLYWGGIKAACNGSKSFVLGCLEFVSIGVRDGRIPSCGGVVKGRSYELFIKEGMSESFIAEIVGG